jgi:hypothetical protein
VFHDVGDFGLALLAQDLGDDGLQLVAGQVRLVLGVLGEDDMKFVPDFLADALGVGLHFLF